VLGGRRRAGPRVRFATSRRWPRARARSACRGPQGGAGCSSSVLRRHRAVHLPSRHASARAKSVRGRVRRRGPLPCPAAAGLPWAVVRPVRLRGRLHGGRHVSARPLLRGGRVRGAAGRGRHLFRRRPVRHGLPRGRGVLRDCGRGPMRGVRRGGAAGPMRGGDGVAAWCARRVRRRRHMPGGVQRGGRDSVHLPGQRRVVRAGTLAPNARRANPLRPPRSTSDACQMGRKASWSPPGNTSSGTPAASAPDTSASVEGTDPSRRCNAASPGR